MDTFIPVGLFGISHHTAPVETREKASLNEEQQKDIIPKIIRSFSVDGCFILSTCNRTEIYLSSEEIKSEVPRVRKWLGEYTRCNCYADDRVVYEKSGTDAVLHFFKVISGIDSQVIGERQISGQVLDSYELSHELKCTDSVLNRLFNFGMQVKRKVHNETFLSDGTVSVSFAGVELAKKIFNDLTDKTVLLIGAGKTAELAAFHFKEKNVRQINVANRTFAKAEKMAADLKGQAFSLENLSAAMEETDIVISATAGKSFILNKTLIKPVVKRRRHKPLFLIDLAIPRDIDPEVNTMEEIFLYNLDDLNEIVKSNMEKRKQEIPKAMTIVHEYTDGFGKWISAYAMSSVINWMKDHLETLRKREVERFAKKLPADNLAEIENMTKSIINKMLRQHIKLLKKYKNDPERYQQQLELMHDLFKTDNN